ncbi:uncharacterized protein LOC134533570 [Bacillus rossius redtenbacheri]|uniref:uncharacterized protein LOC134533570 n=1 Tax=Bacillus rossius redtenbacheri TaxID=93214 RepID=UPI002FDDC022
MEERKERPLRTGEGMSYPARRRGSRCQQLPERQLGLRGLQDRNEALSWLPKPQLSQGVSYPARKRGSLCLQSPERQLGSCGLEDRDEVLSWLPEPQFSRSMVAAKPERRERKAHRDKPARMSVIKAFDKAVLEELKLRDLETDNMLNITGCTQTAGCYPMEESLGTAIKSSLSLNLAPHTTPVRDTQLHEAVDNLVKAELLCKYHAAFQAAQAAAESAPLDQAEEAAVTRAKEFTVEFVPAIKEPVVSEQPVKLLGYIGYTRAD